MKYLERYKKLIEHSGFVQDIELVSRIFVVIPAYKEELEVIQSTLKSLDDAAKNFRESISVLVLVNWNVKDADDIKDRSGKLFGVLSETNLDHCSFTVLAKELSGKKSGVGMARKILMDVAFYNMLKCDIDGLIINLDADTKVSPSYFIKIDHEFTIRPKMEAASIAFAHVDDSDNMDSIIAYELHLRYFINMQRLLKLPFAFQTVGSAMVVRRDAYAKEGGMVKRQAGEDFYFLHKYTKNNTLFEINSTCVYPSSRGSDRVPFGTGKAVNDINRIGSQNYTTYNPISFIALDSWLRFVHTEAEKGLVYSSDWSKSNDKNLNQFLLSVDVDKNIAQITSNVTDRSAFVKRFYNWFDAFMLMKYLHFVRDLGYGDISIDGACDFLFEKLNFNIAIDRESKLKTLRDFDLKSVYSQD